MARFRFGSLFVLVLLSGAASVGHADGATVTSSTTITAIPLEDVPMESDSVSANLSAISSDLASDRALRPIKQDLPLITQEINTRSEITSRLLSASPSLERLKRLEAGWHAIEHNFDAWQRTIARRIGQLDKYAASLKQLADTWDLTLQSAQLPGTPPTVLENVAQVDSSIHQTQESLEKERHATLVIQGSLTRVDAQVDREIDRVNRAYDDALDHLFKRDSPPIWKTAQGSGQAPVLPHQGRLSMGIQAKGLHAYALRQAHKFLIHAVILLGLVLILYWMRAHFHVVAASAMEQFPSAVKIVEAPIASAVILSLVAGFGLYHEAPRLLWAIWGAAALLPTTFLVRRLIARPLHPLIYALVFFYALDQIRDVVATIPLVSRLLFSVEMLAGAIFLAWFLRQGRAGALMLLPSWLANALRLLPVFMGLASLGDLVGFVNLATLMGNAILQSAYLAVVLYTLLQVVEGLLDFAFTVGPLSRLSVVTHKRELLRQRTLNVLTVISWAAWVLYGLNLLSARDFLFDAAERSLAFTFTLGTFSITLGHILSFGLTLWAAILISRFLRFVLDEDVYPRLHLGAGLPYAVSTLLHYMILMFGFFLAIAALGFDMTKMTILAGAFGVGVGFGTQNIVNNFVSGLILLFERPIKVGDAIQVGDAAGVVRKIGIRATTILTTTGSLVVIPNGSLISGNVTNLSVK